MLNFTDISLTFLVLASIVKVLTYFHDRRLMHQLRRDLRFVYCLLRVWALEEPSDHIRRKLLEVLAEEDLP